MTTVSTTSNDTSPLDLICVNTLRTLAIDAVEQAQSGHPGTPMGAAPIAYTLWQRFLRFDPQDTTWPPPTTAPTTACSTTASTRCVVTAT
jgi:transketolase N-terminal domain/subunit